MESSPCAVAHGRSRRGSCVFLEVSKSVFSAKSDSFATRQKFLTQVFVSDVSTVEIWHPEACRLRTPASLVAHRFEESPRRTLQWGGGLGADHPDHNPPSNPIMVNGRNSAYSINVEYGKRYRLRLINGGASWTIKVGPFEDGSVNHEY